MTNEEKKDQLIERMLELAYKSSNEKSKSEKFVYSSIEKLYRMILACDQLGDIGDAKKCIRVIKLKRMIPTYAMECINKMVDENTGLYMKSYCSGCYIGVPCVHISKDTLEKCKKYYGKFVMYDTNIPEITNVSKDIVESTLRINQDGTGIVLEKSPVTDFLFTGSHYSMFEFMKDEY